MKLFGKKLSWKSIRLPWEIGFILILFLASCAGVQTAIIGPPGVPEAPAILDGQPQMVYLGTVLKNIYWGVMENPKIQILYNETKGIVAFSWDFVNGRAYVAIPSSTENIMKAMKDIGYRGTYVSTNDWKILAEAAEKYGWRQITAAELAALAPALCKSVIAVVMNIASQTLPTITLLPVTPGMFDMLPQEAIQ